MNKIKQQFTPIEYLYIGIANHYGLDKKNYDERIQWVKDNISSLESFTDAPETSEPYLYAVAVKALRDTQKGKPIGYIFHQDAICSGIQHLSVMSGCIKGLTRTGLVNTGKREDAYTALYEEMKKTIGDDLDLTRKQCKEALMTSSYGSRAVPKRIFGNNLDVFYDAAYTVCPGAFDMMETLLDAWNDEALNHEYTMPDGFHIKLPVMVKQHKKLEIDELDHYQMAVIYDENTPEENGISLVANVTHSQDSLVVRELIRACNHIGLVEGTDVKDMLLEQYERTNYVSLRWQNITNLSALPDELVTAINKDTELLSSYKPFELVTVHDSFGVSPKYAHIVSYWYKEIMARLSDSKTINSILAYLDRPPIELTHYGDVIRNSEYAIS